jgi:phosphatidylglycerol---prolipoprotein diacylglyceryl transferase
MHPIICTIGPLQVYSYGLMLALAFFVCSTLAVRQCRRLGISGVLIYNMLFYAFCFGIIGARLLYVLQHAAYYLDSPGEIIMLQHGGLSWFGGLIFGVFTALFYMKRNKLGWLLTLDAIIPYIALGQAIGRIGCLLNGCCYGKVSQAGFYFPALEQTRIPTQLYSSLIMLVVYVLLRFLQERPHPTGRIFFIYLCLYGLKRFIIEFWRDDTPALIAGLTLFHFMSIGLLCAGAIGLFWTRRQKLKAGH